MLACLFRRLQSCQFLAAAGARDTHAHAVRFNAHILHAGQQDILLFQLAALPAAQKTVFVDDVAFPRRIGQKALPCDLFKRGFHSIHVHRSLLRDRKWDQRS